MPSWHSARRDRDLDSHISQSRKRQEPRERVQSRAYASPQRLPTRYPPITRETNISVAAAHPQPPHNEEEDGRASGEWQCTVAQLGLVSPLQRQCTHRLSAVSHSVASDEAFSATGAPAPRHLAAEQASSAAVAGDDHVVARPSPPCRACGARRQRSCPVLSTDHCHPPHECRRSSPPGC